MKIVVNARGSHAETVTNLLREPFSLLIKSNQQHQFIFLSDRGALLWLPEDANIIKPDLGAKHVHPVLAGWWQYYRLPVLLKKYRPDVLVNINGSCCMRTNIPQLLMLGDQCILQLKTHKHHVNFLLGYKKRSRSNLVASLQKAGVVTVVSSSAKKELVRLFGTSPEKIFITAIPSQEYYTPLSWEEKELVKAEFTNGKEYFLYHGPIHPGQNILNLLKGFSLFKKRQQSNMQLVLAGKINWPDDGFEKKLNSYKFRSAVVLQPSLTQEIMVKLTGAAYALINPANEKGFHRPQLQAMGCGVPVISAAVDAEPGDDAVLKIPGESPAEIASQMMLLYKDEHLRNQLIAKGNDEKEKYDANKTAAIIWTCITQAVKTH